MNIEVIDYDSCSAAGNNLAELRQSLTRYKSGLIRNCLPGSDIDTWIGKVSAADDINDLGEWQSRNNALAALGYEQGTLRNTTSALMAKYGAARIGLIMGSSTSSIDRTETAYTDLAEDGGLKPDFRQSRVHNPHAPSLFMAHLTGIKGPSLTINTACSSSAKVFVTAARWLEYGVVDAVLVGGVDTLCLSVLHGFNSLQLLSPNPCKPFDHFRDGINLGEASGFAVLQRGQESTNGTGIKLTGYGESSDAHHMSHPHPDGLGARKSMTQALTRGALEPDAIDYINLHGTSSRANDLIEGSLIADLFPKTTRSSSTKAWMGHTLGAAGITEAIITLDTLQTDLIPGSMNLDTLDEALDFTIDADNQHKRCEHVMTNSFGFGGNNCTLLFSREA
ncbi:beta-ketoacyl-ACP synthase [Alteromonas halophila]|uniref:Beta-ketoacyl-[acyl-carrier-protein] synthase II n=1 Tax=Alteromonas halophila TaxID=516698 RepID=A0A918JJY2_9ALTE|nr:beta-ketoacyl-ACP synthase [Alteromonas halophila]GGW84895.1 beta-ketoacyl-[acyl-carrier-protein] synthase II [Alteromonas halophila]